MSGPADRDVFVRDWNDGAAVGDDGTEPSTPINGVDHKFWITSDVWNGVSDTDPGPIVNGAWTGANAKNGGDNFAYALIRRKAAPGSGGPVTVTARLLVSRNGTGSSFVDHTVSDPSYVFFDPPVTVDLDPDEGGPGFSVLTPPMKWRLHQPESGHLCVAVQLTTSQDTYQTNLLGKTPGPAASSAIVTCDNNTAQRNLESVSVPSGGSASGAMVDGPIGIVNNDCFQVIDPSMRVEVVATGGIDLVSPVQVEVFGPGGSKKQVEVVGGTDFTVGALIPGEKRWIAVSLPAVKGPGDAGRVLVNFSQLDGDTVVNGFSVAGDLVPMAGALPRFGAEAINSLNRLAALDVPDAIPLARGAERAVLDTDPRTFLDWARDERDALVSVVGASVDLLGTDVFGVEQAVNRYLDGLERLEPAAVAALQSNIWQRLDAALTMREIDGGDVFEILHTVRWHLHVLDRRAFAGSRAADAVRRRLSAFVDAVETKEAGYKGYPRLLAECLLTLDARGDGAAPDSARLAIALGRAVDLAPLQKAHRAYVLALAAR